MRVTTLLLLATIGWPLLSGQDLKPVANATPSPSTCQAIKSKQYLDTYIVCDKPGHADVLQIQFGENAGPKIHIFVGKTAWNRHFNSVEHKNCSDFLVADGSKAAKRIQKGFRRNK